MITELIASTKSVIANGRELVIVTTASGATVWVSKSQLDSSAEQISYDAKKAGAKYITKDGVEGVLKSDRNDFVGCGKQIIKKYDAKELLASVIAAGVTPTFSLS